MIERLARRVASAQGKTPVDTLVVNARVVNVFTGRIEERDVAIDNGVFVGFGKREARTVVDAHGLYMLPGLIDAHIHIESSFLSPTRFAELALPHGTTSVAADPHELANVCGTEGIRYVLECAEKLPLHIFVTLPSCVPATPFEDAGAVLTASDMKPFMGDSRVIAIGEMMNFPGVLAQDKEVLAKVALGLEYGKPVNGHAPCLSGVGLDAYLSTGISDTHEASTIAEMNEMLERGGYVFLRQGSAAQDLLKLLPAITPENARRCAFCCDDRHASDLMDSGEIDNILRLSVKAGLDPIRAITMATLNASEALGLKHKGAIALSRDADFILVDNLTDFNVYQTYTNGILVAENGKVIVSMPSVSSQNICGTMHVAPIADDAFAMHIPSGEARVIGLDAGSLVTSSNVRRVRTDSNGRVLFGDDGDPSLIAVVERHKGTGKIGVGLLDGFGVRGGAVATSVAHDSHNIVVAGDSEASVRVAVEAVIALGGGCVLVKDSKVIGSLALPLAGLMTDEAPSTVIAQLEELLCLAHNELGIPQNVEPFMALSFMALTVIPSLKITARGLFDVNSFCFTNVDASIQ